MKSILVIVPRMLIKAHLPHPEFYGESLVTLLNDMVTDVFTTKQGDLVTETNHKQLIAYLKKNYIEDPNIVISKDAIMLRSIRLSDVDLVLEWMNTPSIYSFNDMPYNNTDVKTFISHAITQNAHLFMIEKGSIAVGFIGYDVIDHIGIMDIKVYNKKDLKDEDVDLVLSLLLAHVSKAYGISKFSSLVFEHDTYTTRLLKRHQFIQADDETIELPVSEDLFQRANPYYYESYGMILGENDEALLHEFLITYPHRLYELSNSDQLIDLEYAIDYVLKTYIKCILKRQVQNMNALEDIYLDDSGDITIEDNLIQKYDEMMAQLSGTDLDVALNYKRLMIKILPTINRYKKAYLRYHHYYK